MLTFTVLLFSFLLQASPVLPEFQLAADLKKQVSSRRSKPGDEVTLAVRNAVSAKDGTVIIPAGATLVANVVMARKRSGGEPSALSFVVGRAEWNGGSMPLNAVLQRLEAVASFHSDACPPSLTRSGAQYGCQKGGTELQRPPADCAVTQVGENMAITCAKREVELAPESVLVFKTVAPRS